MAEIPHAPEAEEAVLCAMLLDPGVTELVVDAVGPEDFFGRGNRIVFLTARRLFQTGQGLDVVAIADALRAAGKLDEAGGLPHLARLVDAVPDVRQAAAHCELLREKRALRELVAAAGELADDARTAAPGEGLALLERAAGRVGDLLRTSDRGDYWLAADLVIPALAEFEDAWSRPGDAVGLRSGLADLDALTSGWQPGQLIILAGRPSMGKTAMALDFLRHASIDRGHAAGLFSLEMSRTELMKRLIATEARVPFSLARSTRPGQADAQRLAEAAGRLKLATLAIDDTAGLSTTELRARARRMRDREGVELIVVDYLQLMEAESAANREQEIASISRGLKRLAKDLELPVIALSQLSREPERRGGNHRPVLADLRESGAIEQDADLVLFVFREEVYTPATDPRYREVEGRAELIVGKQRNGPTGTVRLFFRKPLISFEPYTSRRQDDAA